MFPITLNLSGRLVVVVGGGAVGMRKLAALAGTGAAVRLIDPKPLALPPEVTHVVEAYRAEHLDGAALVFACANPEVNSQVVKDARDRGAWVNSASAPETGNFALPAVVRRGNLTLAINTGGAAPALARRIREKLEAEFDEAFAEWVRVLAEVRRVVLAEVADEAQRRALLDSFAEWHWLARLRSEGAPVVEGAMRTEIRRLCNEPKA